MLIKDYLGFENARNKSHAQAYIDLVKLAFGLDTAVFIGHHISLELNGDLSTENEIPSADSLIFDHEIMGKVFGEDAIPLVVRLAMVPCGERDEMLATAISSLQLAEVEA